MSIQVVPDQNQDPIRRLTNQNLWHSILSGISDFSREAVEKELERRLRKIAFLPALPPKEDS